jgi:translation initiation factor IF-2
VVSKLRVTDLSVEFGIPNDEVIALLRAIDVTVRSHMSALTDDQVARVRARWEREKRARADKPTDAAPAKGRRRAVGKPTKAEPVPEPVEDAAASDEAKPAVRRRRRVDVEKQQAEEAAEAEAQQAVADAAAAVVAAAAAAEAAAQAAAAQAEADRAAAAAAERAAARAAAAAEEAARASTVAAEQAAATPSVAPDAAHEPPAPAAPAGAAPSDAMTSKPASAPVPRPVGPSGLSLPDRPRPRPFSPGAPRPRPVQGGGMPRPIASAAPGGPGAGPRMGGPGGSSNARPGGSQGTAGAGPAAGRRGGKKGKRGPDQEAVAANLSKTMRDMRGAPGRRGARRGDAAEMRELLEAQRVEAAERERKTVRVNEFITVSELAQTLGVPATQIVSFAFKTLGLMVTINQRLDFDQIELIAGEFGFQAVREEDYTVGAEEQETPDDASLLSFRPPVVTIMGHVDHGKTSLLDYIRRTNVVAGESGGITQHIGAYHVELPGGKMITFLDTPGHQAFTAMRARGAQVTDIVVLVVAADDSVMPQTIEAISHAKNAGVPLIVAINKIDLPAANPIKVKQELLQYEVVLEDFGGQVLSTELSAKAGTNVDVLLEQLLLQAEILDLKANPDRAAAGTVIEAQLDAGKGPVATVLVQNGTLKVGDDFICGMHSGRVRALLDERGKQVKRAGPAIPVQILGLTGVPMAGDQLVVVNDANAAREIAQRRERLDREAKSRRTSKTAVSLESFMAQAAAGEKQSLKILIKADQGGPAEALADALVQLSNAEVQVEVVARAVGAVTESDILLAKASGAIILGFHVRPDTKARAAAEREGVDIRLYKIIYEAVNDVKAALEGMLAPEQKEVILGEAEVREVFKVSRVGTIAGCSVRSGTISRKARVRIIRDGVEIFEGNISSLKRFKDDVAEVRDGFECGIGIENFNDVKVGDVIEGFRTDSVARSLADTAAS